MNHSAIDSLKRTMTSRQVSLRRLMPVLLSSLALLAGPAAWAAASPTTTSLFTTPQNPSSGAVITMTAQVSSTEFTVGGGTVTFTDKYNNVTEVLGTVQVQSAVSGNAGTAVLAAEVGGVGQHQFVATFNATSNFLSSASTVQSVTFIAPYLSATALAATATSPYTFTSTVSAFGPSAPTGSVTFTDTTSNFTLGTVGLNSGSLMTGFAPYSSYPVSNINNGQTGGTNAPAIGDFNGDGRLDYALPTNAGPIYIFLGKGDGTFTAGTTIASQSGFVPTSVVVGDFNGDGKQDLAVLSSTGGGTGNAGTIDIYLGKGNGTFQTEVNYLEAPLTSTSSSRILAVGDFNRDGYQDLVATNANLNTVSVLLGNGDGTFGLASSFGVGSLPWNVVVGDLNNDGFQDLVIASDGSSSASVLQGNGDGTFKTFTAFNTSGSQVGSVAIGDFNGDGWLDIASTSAQNNNAYILLNTKVATAPTFAAAVSYPITPGPYYLTVGDFNRDGKLDLIAATDGTNATSVGVLLGTGSGSFGAATYYSVGGGSFFANAADINGDDQVDLTAITTTGLSVLLSGEAETAVLSNTVISGCGKQSVTATYGGDSNYGQSTSAALTFTSTQITTGLALSVVPVNGVVGQQYTLTATLSPYNYGSTTTNGETVTFTANGGSIGTANLVNGVATLNITPTGTGSYNVQASYPGDCTFIASNSAAIPVTVKTASTLTWNNPAAITYGTPLTSTQLNATDSVPGTFAYTPAAGTILPAGTNTLSVTFTPTDTTTYGVETTTVTIQVNKEGTVITWPTPTPITYGTPLSGFQLDATATTGTTSVNLAPYYNVSGIYDPGTSYSTGGFDNDGYSYSSKTLSGSVLLNGLTYTLGPVNAPDGVYGTGTPIPLPAGKFAGLFMLGAMVNNIPPAETFTVTYTDGTTTVLNQNMSDWFNAAGWPGESVVNCSEKRNYKDGTQQSDSVCVYGYSITLDPTKIVQSVTIPNTRNIIMLAMDLTTPPVPGTFVYTPASGTVEPVGTDTLSVAFTPTDTTDYGTSTGTVNLVVTNAVTPIVTPTISWPTPANIPFGTALSSTQLDAVAMGTPRPTPVTPTSQLVPIATSTDGTGYNLNGFDTNGNTYSYKQLGNGSVQFAGTTFTLGQPNVPDSITNGAVYSLGSAQGNYSSLYLIGAATTTGQTAQPFILTYNDAGNPVTETIDMSSWAQSAGYSDESIVATTTYANTKGGGEISGTYDLYGYVLPVDPTRTLVSVSVPNTRNVVIMALGFGTNTQVVVPGTYAYNPTAGTVLSVGTHTLNVTFTPSNTQGYTSATDSVQIIVTKATPIITWPTPAAIPVGTALSSTQLDATASINGVSLPGTYVYTPASGTVLAAGTQTLNVTFTPNDTTDYTTAMGSVQIVVGTTGATSLSGAPVYETGDCCFFSQPTPYVVTVGGSTAAPTGALTVTFNGNTLASGTLVPGSGSTSTVSFNVNSSFFVPGGNTVTLNYGGDTNYVPATNTAVIQLRNPAIVSNPTSVGGGSSTEIIPYTYVTAGTITLLSNPTNPTGGSISDFTNTTNSTCPSGTAEPAGFVCTFNVAFAPVLPGIRKGVLQVNFTDSSNNAEPTLYLYLSGLGDAAQISLGSGSQTTLSSGLNQPQGLTFKPNDTTNTTLYVNNSDFGTIDTIPATGGSLTQWNPANTKNLVYPSDLVFDAFGNLIVSDANAPGVFSFNNSLAESTVSTTPYSLGLPTAVRLDFAGNLYIADAGSTPRILEVSGESGDANYVPTVALTGSNVSFPQSLAVDNSGSYLYVGDGNLSTIQQLTLSTGAVSTINISPCDSTVTSCALNSPAGMAFDPNGDMFITDSGQRVLMVPANHSSGGKTTQLPITGLNNPSAITLDGSGNIYITDLNTSVTKWQANSGALTVNPLNASVTTTITNTGNLNLSIAALTFGHGSSSSFTETDTCVGTAVVPGGTCSITITYSNSAGAATDTLTITSNAFTATGVTIKLTN